MEILLHKNQFPQGTKYSIQFLWDSEQFVIRTYEKEFIVQDNEIVKKGGQYHFDPSKQNPKYTSLKIEIPLNVIDRKNKLNMDLQNRKGSIARVDHTAGKMYFSINTDGKIVAKMGCKTASSDMEIIENKKAINVESLGLEFPYIEVPSAVEAAFLKVKHDKIMLNCRLIYSGNSQLTGQKHYKLNYPVPTEKWDCIKDLFEFMGEGSGKKGELKGWLTNQPGKVEATLGLKPTAGRRGHDDIKQFEDAITLLETAK